MERRKYKRQSNPPIDRVLIIDDSECDVALIKQQLSGYVKVLDSAGTIADGLFKARTHTYDYILLDVLMPDGDGREHKGTFQGYGYDEEQIIVMSALGAVNEKYKAVQKIIGQVPEETVTKGINAMREVVDRHTCKFESKINKMSEDIAVIASTLPRMKKHMAESDDPIDGYRDRLLKTEQSVKFITKYLWIMVLVASSIGGLMVKYSDEVLGYVAKVVFHG